MSPVLRLKSIRSCSWAKAARLDSIDQSRLRRDLLCSKQQRVSRRGTHRPEPDGRRRLRKALNGAAEPPRMRIKPAGSRNRTSCRSRAARAGPWLEVIKKKLKTS